MLTRLSAEYIWRANDKITCLHCSLVRSFYLSAITTTFFFFFFMLTLFYLYHIRCSVWNLLTFFQHTLRCVLTYLRSGFSIQFFRQVEPAISRVQTKLIIVDFNTLRTEYSFPSTIQLKVRSFFMPVRSLL